MAKAGLFNIFLQHGTITVHDMGVDFQQLKHIDISNVLR